jgi:hypothetical protein
VGFGIPFCSGFPNLFLPDTLTEGYATLAESELVSGGRMDSPLGSLYLRNLAYGGGFPSLGGALAIRRFFPMGDTPYLLGASFQRSLDEHTRSLTRFYRSYAQGCFPCLPCLPFLMTTGSLPENAWSRWQREEIGKARRYFETFTHPTPHTRLSGPFLEIRSLFWDKKEGRVYGTVSDGIHHEAIGTFRESGQFQRIIERHGGNALAKEGETFLYDEFEWEGDIVLTSRAVLLQRGVKKVLGGHRFEPDLFGDRWVSVVREGNRYCLEVRTLSTSKLLHRFCESFPILLHHPRFIPGGKGILFIREGLKTRSDIYFWDMERDRITPLLATEENEWSPRMDETGGGVYLLRVTDGVPDLHYLELTRSTLYRVTRIPIGMVEYAVDERGGRVWFTSVGKDGFSLYSSPLPPRSGWEQIPISTPTPLPPSPPPPTTLPSTPYTPLPSLLPTALTPILFLTPSFRGGGITLSGEDPLGDYRYTLTSLLLSSPKGIQGAFSLGVAYDAGLWVLPAQLQWVPGALLGSSSRWAGFLDLMVLRRFRKIHHLSTIRIGLSQELYPSTNLYGVFGNAGFRLDTRRSPAFFADRGDGILFDLRLDEGRTFSGINSYPDSHISSSLLLSPLLLSITPSSPLQAHILFAGGAHSNLASPLRFTLLPPALNLSLPRSFLSHASPPSGVSNLDKVGVSELQLVFPILWVNEGLFSLPIYLDGILLRPFTAGAIWDGPEGKGNSLFLGAELEVDLVAGWNIFLPLRFGARWNPLVGQREYYLGIFLSDDLVLPRLKEKEFLPSSF